MKKSLVRCWKIKKKSLKTFFQDWNYSFLKIIGKNFKLKKKDGQMLKKFKNCFWKIFTKNVLEISTKKVFLKKIHFLYTMQTTGFQVNVLVWPQDGAPTHLKPTVFLFFV